MNVSQVWMIVHKNAFRHFYPTQRSCFPFLTIHVNACQWRKVALEGNVSQIHFHYLPTLLKTKSYKHHCLKCLPLNSFPADVYVERMLDLSWQDIEVTFLEGSSWKICLWHDVFKHLQKQNLLYDPSHLGKSKVHSPLISGILCHGVESFLHQFPLVEFLYVTSKF